jgi:2-oxoglutarate ferredoxin oxidoreductase subunit gamma
MEHDVIIAGFGGQGALLMGKVLAYAGMREGNEVSWLPSYGPEMRGGTAHCTVIVATRPIGSPLVCRPRAIVALNRPSLDKFEPLVKPGGLVVMNTSLVRREAARRDLTVVKLPATEIAATMGHVRAANMVTLGAYVTTARPMSIDSVTAAMDELFGGSPAVLEANRRAFARGVEIGMAQPRVEAA